MTDIVTAMFNISNFKIFETQFMKSNLALVFGYNSKLQNIIFEQGVLVTGAILFAFLGIVMFLLSKVTCAKT